MFAKDTLEDPANRIDRDGFLDEIERISEATGVFDSAPLRRARRVPRRAGSRGGSRARTARALRAGRGRGRCDPRRGARRRHGRCARRRGRRGDRVRAPDLRARGSSRARVPIARCTGSKPVSRSRFRRRTPRGRTSSPSWPSLPVIAKPKVVPKRLSTGQMALEIARIGVGWRISCTGCGESSPLVQFRWQVLDQTVDCRCP